MYLPVPLVAIVFVAAFDLTWGTQAALLFLSISAGAPLLPRKLIKLGGDPAYVFRLVVATSLLAIITVPLSLAFACATRHIGLAMLVAAHVRGPETLALVAA
jgi:BASS family bile acid:Na+ symporter